MSECHLSYMECLHGGDVDNPLHGLGFVNAAPQQALRVQAGLGIGVAEPGQEGSLARHVGHFGAIRGRGPDLHDGGGGTGGPAAAAAVAAAAAAAVAVTVAAAVAVATAARARAGSPAPGGPSLKCRFFSRQNRYLVLQRSELFLIIGNHFGPLL